MNTNRKLGSLQQSQLQKYSQSSTPHTFFNVLTSPALLSTVEDLLPVHRERSFPPTETLSMFLAQAMNTDSSCQNIVNEAALTRAICGLPPCSSNTGSYCKARQRLPLSMVSGLVRQIGLQMTDQAPLRWNWQGRPIRLVDGTTVELPDTEENRRAYPQTREGSGCPLSRIVGITCLASGGVLNAAIGPFAGKGSGEQALLRTLLDTFTAGDIVLGDAYFGTYFLLAELMARNVDAVFEQYGARKRTLDFSRGQQIGKRDHLLCYEKPKKPAWISQESYDAAPDTITVRELEVGHKILVTTLLSPEEASKHALKELYQQRWHVELDLRNIKSTLGMGVLSCKTPDMIEKEIWIYLLAHNLIRVVMAEAASLSDILPRQLSFKHSLQLWRIWRQQSSGQDDQESLRALLRLTIENTVGHRPGRVEPRMVKRWRKSFPLLTKPRSELRETIKIHGHPRKPRLGKLHSENA
jgi:Transposase DDE domain